MSNRRKFLEYLTKGVAGAAVFPSLTGGDKSNYDKFLQWSENEHAKDREAYWELVKTQFRFAEGMTYFNNASLGPSPIPVQHATKSYRELLDGFPSKYRWGGWKEEIEKTRTSVAEIFTRIRQ